MIKMQSVDPHHSESLWDKFIPREDSCKTHADGVPAAEPEDNFCHYSHILTSVSSVVCPAIIAAFIVIQQEAAASTDS